MFGKYVLNLFTPQSVLVDFLEICICSGRGAATSVSERQRRKESERQR
jgi:hypothetical protein